MRSSRLEYLFGILVLPGMALGLLARNSQNSSNHSPQKVRQESLRAPTLYLVIDKSKCWGEEIEVRGASNLPSGAVIDLRIADFHDDGWTYYSDQVSATVGVDGYFTAKIPLKQRVSLPHNLIVVADFGTIYHRQPSNVLQVVGDHGQNLDDLDNPQAHAVSGFNTILSTIARAPCGSKSK